MSLSSVTGVRLPPVLRPRPHHPLLRRGPGRLQFGTGARAGVEVAELSAPLYRLLCRLPERPSWSVDELVELGARVGAVPDEVRAVLAGLHAEGALLDDARARRLASARHQACVLVEGAGPLAAPVLAGLGLSGVGRLLVPPGREAALGTARAELAGGAAPLPVEPVLEVLDGRDRPDLVLLTDALAPAPSRAEELRAEGTAHLPARVCDDIGLVGPLVLPGRSACLGCLERHQGDVDPHRAVVRQALGEQLGSGGPAAVRATAALAVAQAVLALDGLVAPGAPPPTLDAVLELDPVLGELQRREWPPHPGCGCGAADIARPPAPRAPSTSAGTTRKSSSGDIEGMATCGQSHRG
jgi:bacteriocin biosynthesis cyclodehydratase domain-containing protein